MNYSLWSEITVGKFVLTKYKVCTKCPTVISNSEGVDIFLTCYSTEGFHVDQKQQELLKNNKYNYF
jgi:hypothetical protein